MAGSRKFQFLRAVAFVGPLVLTAASFPAGAACTQLQYGDFGQLQPNCGDAYCYVVSPGANSAASVVSSFWSFANGQPQIGSGTDNGSWSDDVWLPVSGPGAYLGGSWSQSPSIDGCIDNQIAPGKPSEIMVAAFSDEDAFGTKGYFAVAAARRFLNASPEFDFTFAAGGGVARDIALVEIPRSAITIVTRDSLTFAGPTLATLSAGFYADASLGAGEALVGYRLYSRATQSPSRLRSSGWSPATGTIPLGQQVTIPFSCSASPTYYATSLVYDSGFESAHLSSDTRVLCRCVDADGDGFSSDVECPPDGPWDCDDANPNVHPFALETCNGLDDDCDRIVDNAPLPATVATLRLTENPGVTRLSWNPLPVATSYDVVAGDLLALRATDGDFALATDACLADDLTASQWDDAAAVQPGAGVWYLLRAENCTGSGTYDGPGAAQRAPRDAGISASAEACP